MLLSNGNAQYNGSGGAVGEGNGVGGGAGLWGGGPSKDAFGRPLTVAMRDYSELPATPPTNLNLLLSPEIPTSHLPHPSFTTTILSNATFSTSLPPRSPLTPPGPRSPTLIHQINGSLADILWAGDAITLNDVLNRLATLDAGLGRDVRSSAGRAFEAGRLVEYVRGVMRSVGLGVEGVGRFTFLAHDVEKLIAPIGSIINELVRIRGSTVTSTFPMLAAIKFVESSALGLSLDVREISLNRIVSHDAKILTLRDTIAELRSRVDNYYDDLAAAQALELASASTEEQVGEEDPNTTLVGVDSELTFDDQIGSLFKMLSAASVSHIEHVATVQESKAVVVDLQTMHTVSAAREKQDSDEEDGDAESQGGEARTGHSSSSDAADEEDEELIVVKK